MPPGPMQYVSADGDTALGDRLSDLQIGREASSLSTSTHAPHGAGAFSSERDTYDHATRFLRPP